MTPPISFTEDGRKHLDELYRNAVDAGRTWTDDDSSASDIDADLFLAEVGKHWPAISVALAAYDAQSRRIAELVETARIEAVHAQEWEKTARAANVRLAELQRALEEATQASDQMVALESALNAALARAEAAEKALAWVMRTHVKDSAIIDSEHATAINAALATAQPSKGSSYG